MIRFGDRLRSGMIITVLLLSDGLLGLSSAQAAPESSLWDYWSAYDANSTEAVNHADWDTFQLKYVFPGKDGVHRVAYGDVLPADRAMLERYINRLSTVIVTGLNRPEQMAYWINLYNALTIKVILDHYPVSSIRDIDISPGLFADGPWGKALIKIEGNDLSLDDIEHRILRPIWQDPRIHYVVNCAAIGCPNLIGHAFTPAEAEKILNQSAREYVNHPRGVQVRSGRIIVSSIYNWFQEDFGGTEKGVLQHLAKYADAPLAEIIKSATSIDGYEYDWALNDIKPRIADKLRKRGS